MDHFCVYISVIIFLKGINADCPDIKIRDNLDLNTFNWTRQYPVFAHSFINSEVQSPFFLFGNGTNFSFLSNQSVYSNCPYKTDKGAREVLYIAAKLISINGTNRMKVDYQNDEGKVFCNKKFKMEEVSVLDFKSDVFISFYACVDIWIDGNPTIAQGAFVFADNFKFLPLDLTNTYRMLEEHTTIKKDSITFRDFRQLFENSCDDIKELQRICKIPKLNILILCLVIVICLIATVVIVKFVQNFFKQFSRNFEISDIS